MEHRINDKRTGASVLSHDMTKAHSFIKNQELKQREGSKKQKQTKAAVAAKDKKVLPYLSADICMVLCIYDHIGMAIHMCTYVRLRTRGTIP